jgi:hypothetical protein
MRGGGDCWSWSRMKDGDSKENDCADFLPLDEVGIVQKQMYALRATPSENGFSLSVMDMFLHVCLIRVERDSIQEGVSAIASIVNRWHSYFVKCCHALAPAKTLRISVRLYSKLENETIGNPQSDMRKRLNTIVRGFPRNIQISYRLNSKYGQKFSQLRIFNIDGEPALMMCNDNADYVGIGEYCSNPMDKEIAHIVLSEFVDYAKFFGSLGKEIGKIC